jgi:hypothetical protein
MLAATIHWCTPQVDADSALLISPSTLTRRPANCFDTAASTADLMVRVRDAMSDSCSSTAQHSTAVVKVVLGWPLEQHMGLLGEGKHGPGT